MIEKAEKQLGSIVVRKGGRRRAGGEVDGQVRRGRTGELDVSCGEVKAWLVATLLCWQAIVAKGGAENGKRGRFTGRHYQIFSGAM